MSAQWPARRHADHRAASGVGAATDRAPRGGMSVRPSISELKRMLVGRMESLLPRILRDVHPEASDLVGWARDGTKFKVVVRGWKRGFVLDTSAPHAKGLERR